MEENERITGIFSFALIIIASIIIISIFCSCKTKRLVVSEQEKSATSSQSSGRAALLSQSDTTSLRLKIDADSMIILFCDTAQSFSCLHNALLPPSRRCLEGESASSKPPDVFTSGRQILKPKAIKIYGLHADKNVDKQSAASVSSQDSSKVLQQSYSSEKLKEKKSSPYPLWAIAIISINIVLAIIIIIYSINKFKK
ncbi:MAG: hypothetical protein IKR05_08380 [Prevotella sp.]|nr:hypothetical protein [Prevotella sp.]